MTKAVRALSQSVAVLCFKLVDQIVYHVPSSFWNFAELALVCVAIVALASMLVCLLIALTVALEVFLARAFVLLEVPHTVGTRASWLIRRDCHRLNILEGKRGKCRNQNCELYAHSAVFLFNLLL